MSAATRPGLGGRWQAAVFLLSFVIVFSRLPGAFLHPQFFAEDGWAWYQQAYNLGWLRSLCIPQAGYQSTLPRLVTGLTLLFPMGAAPFLMNLAGATIQVLPVNALLSPRCTTWGPLPLRMVMALLYLAIPNAPEVHVVVTNAMWHVAVLQALLAFSVPPLSWRGRAVDVLLFVVASVSGPFSILLLPCIVAWWWWRRERWTQTIFYVLLPGTILQLVTLAHATRTPGAPLQMTWLRLLRIVAGNVFINSMTGGGGAFLRLPFLLVAAVGGLAVIGWACKYGGLALRLFVVFTSLVLAASLRDPLLLGHLTSRWEALSNTPMIRYWYLPSLMFLWCGATSAWQAKAPLGRLAGWGVLLLSTLGITYKWTYPAWPPSDYQAEVARFQTLKRGEHMLFPVHDPGDRPMELVKK